MRQKGTHSDGGSWGIREYDVRVGCFLSLRQLCQKANIDGEKQNSSSIGLILIISTMFTLYCDYCTTSLFDTEISDRVYIFPSQRVPQVEQVPSVCDQQMNDDGDLFGYCAF